MAVRAAPVPPAGRAGAAVAALGLQVQDLILGSHRSHTALGWSADWAGPWRASSLLRAYSSRFDVGNRRTLGVAPIRPQSLRDDVIDRRDADGRGGLHIRLGGAVQAPGSSQTRRVPAAGGRRDIAVLRAPAHALQAQRTQRRDLLSAGNLEAGARKRMRHPAQVEVDEHAHLELAHIDQWI